ncbi:MAG: transcription antitermination factor NusB [Atribacterota bacterium]|nr:transcription antitermination factor NusB [Atribacterota bacterium]
MRTQAREIAFRILFQKDLRGKSMSEILSLIKIPRVWDEKTVSFFLKLTKGLEEKLEEVDQVLNESIEGWSLARLANVDRNVLRIATYEILFLPEIPVNVAINEAVELGKRYGTEESGKFINGVLGRLVKKVGDDRKGRVNNE